jgi:hypothetical protein
MNQRNSTLLSVVALFFMSTVITSCSSSRRSIGVEEGWELLSSQKVNFVKDKDEIQIDSQTQYTALKFKVEDKEVHIHDLTVYFRNGDKLEPNLDAVIPADAYSREIELATEGRHIDRISFKYRSTGSLLKGRANVLLFGKKYYTGY